MTLTLSRNDPFVAVAPGAQTTEAQARLKTLVDTQTKEEPKITGESLDVSKDKINALYFKNREEVAATRKLKKERDAAHKARARAKKDVSEVTAEVAKSVLKSDNENSMGLDEDNSEMMDIRGEDILKVKYSQDSIGEETMDGTPLDQLIDNMIVKGWRKNVSITVIKINDILVSLDNRRLFAAKVAFKITKLATFTISAIVYPCKQRAPRELFRGIQIRFSSDRRKKGLDDDYEKIPECIDKGSYGHCLKLRMHTRNGDLDSDIFGYDHTFLRCSEDSIIAEDCLRILEGVKTIGVKTINEEAKSSGQLVKSRVSSTPKRVGAGF
ncbi:MAG: hypothetical protein H0W88_02110 [Parachlamydiaceae bacterium]|nr:hypothetical protein [Parachlamydiaceae bacterium]